MCAGCGLITLFQGLLVSACVLRAPTGTFGAAVSDVGVHDLLRVCDLFNIHATRAKFPSFSSINLPSVCFMLKGVPEGECLNLLVTGRAWISDYGNPDDPDDFDFIYPISPLHNVPSDKILPPLLLSTADRERGLILSAVSI